MIDHAMGTGPASMLSRRAALGAGLGVGMAAMVASAPAAARTLDIARPEDAIQIYRKMRYRTDSGLLFAWVEGPHFAEVDAKLTPLYGLSLGSIQRVTQRPDGGFEVKELEISFYTDPDTGARLTEFRNPITNELLPVPTRRPAVTSVSYSSENELHAPTTYGEARFEVDHYPTPPFIIGDDVFIRDRSRARVTPPHGPQRTVNELSTFVAPRAVVLDPAVASVDARVQSNDVVSWPTWLKMGDAAGMMALYGVGGKAARFEDMPADWLTMLHEVWPDIAAAPVAALDAG